jgi:hypothetical protein
MAILLVCHDGTVDSRHSTRDHPLTVAEPLKRSSLHSSPTASAKSYRQRATKVAELAGGAKLQTWPCWRSCTGPFSDVDLATRTSDIPLAWCVISRSVGLLHSQFGSGRTARNRNKFREDFLLTRKDTLRGGIPVQLETNSGPTLNFSRLRTLCVSPQAAIRVSTGTSVLP